MTSLPGSVSRGELRPAPSPTGLRGMGVNGRREPCTHPALPAMKLAGVTRPFYCYVCGESVDPDGVQR